GGLQTTAHARRRSGASTSIGAKAHCRDGGGVAATPPVSTTGGVDLREAPPRAPAILRCEIKPGMTARERGAECGSSRWQQLVAALCHRRRNRPLKGKTRVLIPLSH